MTRSGGGLRCNVALLGQSGALASDKIPIFRGWLVLQANNARRKVRAKSALGQFLKSCNLCATFVVAAFSIARKKGPTLRREASPSTKEQRCGAPCSTVHVTRKVTVMRS